MMNTNSTDHEYIACALCGRSQDETLFVGGDLLHPAGETFRMAVCGHCGHIYQTPRPNVSAIDRYYPPDYMPFFHAIEDEKNPFRRLERTYGRHMRCSAIHRAMGKQAGRILDVGCATGIFLHGMQQLGWEVAGVEPTASAATYARERFNLPVFMGRLEDAGYPDQHFDVVTMWDVLEHVHDPQAVLAETSRILRPGGLLVLSLPNPDSIEARTMGEYWMGWDLPRHLNLFRPRQLNTLLRKHAMEVAQIRSFTAGYSVLIMSLEQRANAQGKDGRKLARRLNMWPLRLLAKLYFSGPAAWFNLSSIMVVFARRVEQA